MKDLGPLASDDVVHALEDIGVIPREALKSRSHLTVVKQNPRVTVLQATCPDCGIVDEMTVSSPSLQMWVRGDLIQNAFPELTDDQRERFLTGYCDPCWQKMWAYLNDEEDEG